RIAAGDQRRSPALIEDARNAAVVGGRPARPLVAQSEVERQLWCDPPVVLGPNLEISVPQVRGEDIDARLRCERIAEQVIAERLAGEKAGVGVLAARLDGLGEIVAVPPDRPAEAELVCAHRVVEAILHL